MKNDVRERREAAGLSQADLGAAVDVTRQTINAIERERYDPSLELAFKLAAYFGCAVEDLFHPDVDVAATLEDDAATLDDDAPP